MTHATEDLNCLASNLVLLREAEAIAALLHHNKIAAVFLKGIALLDTAYSDPACRPMADVDILVRRADLQEAVTLISASGFSMCPNALVLRKRLGRISVQVDLHPELWCFATEDFWSRCRQKHSGSHMWVLSSEDQLLHTMLHGLIQDGHIAPQAAEDCRRILDASGDRFNWDAFVSTVLEEGWQRPVYLFLARLEIERSGCVPYSVWQRLSGTELLLWNSLLGRPPYVRMLLAQSRGSRRLIMFVRLLVPDFSFLRLRYSWMPRQLGFLLPLLRPIFLLANYFHR